jgi:hypothetical protein
LPVSPNGVLSPDSLLGELHQPPGEPVREPRAFAGDKAETILDAFRTVAESEGENTSPYQLTIQQTLKRLNKQHASDNTPAIVSTSLEQDSNAGADIARRRVLSRSHLPLVIDHEIVGGHIGLNFEGLAAVLHLLELARPDADDTDSWVADKATIGEALRRIDQPKAEQIIWIDDDLAGRIHAILCEARDRGTERDDSTAAWMLELYEEEMMVAA